MPKLKAFLKNVHLCVCVAFFHNIFLASTDKIMNKAQGSIDNFMIKYT